MLVWNVVCVCGQIVLAVLGLYGAIIGAAVLRSKVKAANAPKVEPVKPDYHTGTWTRRWTPGARNLTLFFGGAPASVTTPRACGSRNPRVLDTIHCTMLWRLRARMAPLATAVLRAALVGAVVITIRCSLAACCVVCSCSQGRRPDGGGRVVFGVP